jgi:hypothetical protein
MRAFSNTEQGAVSTSFSSEAMLGLVQNSMFSHTALIRLMVMLIHSFLNTPTRQIGRKI